jgi:hypothetical protein
MANSNRATDAAIELARRILDKMPPEHITMNYHQLAIVFKTMWDNGYHIVHPELDGDVVNIAIDHEHSNRWQ